MGCAASRVSGGDLAPRQRGHRGVQQPLIALDHGDVVRFLVAHQPIQVGTDGVQRVERDHRAGQLFAFEQGPEVAGLVVFGADRHLVEQTAAMFQQPE